MTKQEHEEVMNAQADKYLTKISEREEVIADLKWKLAQHEIATSALGWLIKKAMEKPEVNP